MVLIVFVGINWAFFNAVSLPLPLITKDQIKLWETFHTNSWTKAFLASIFARETAVSFVGVEILAWALQHNRVIIVIRIVRDLWDLIETLPSFFDVKVIRETYLTKSTVRAELASLRTAQTLFGCIVLIISFWAFFNACVQLSNHKVIVGTFFADFSMFS